MKPAGIAILIITGALMLSGCSADELPSRDQIPILRENLFALEQAIKARSRAALDTLLSVDILDVGQDSDSLLRFVYGPEDDFPFSRLGGYQIFFSHDLAVIDCFIMDSTDSRNRPLRLSYKHDQETWLLNRFQIGRPDSAAGS